MLFQKVCLLVFLSVLNLEVHIEAAEYRLPRSILPTNYHIIIELEPDAFTTNRFEGQVNITLNVLEETQQVQLHSKSLEILNITLTEQNENSTVLNNGSFTNNVTTDILTIPTTELLAPGSYILSIDYRANLSLYDMHGLYKSTYQNKQGEVEFLAATQFEVTHARKAFPCFDEPSFKATFNLTVIYPKGYNVIANTPQNGNIVNLSDQLEIVHFHPTPVMSTYLNAFIVSNFTCDTTNGTVPFRVCSRAETRNDRRYALEVSPKLLNYLENWTGISYDIAGIGKMDQVALPDFSAGAMENWGLVTYKERALLWNECHSSNFFKQRVATIIAHEFSHMWFGDLVTLKWWSDVFLNEGFARYFQYLATNEVEPKWEMEKQFVVQQVHSALLADSMSTSVALSSNVSTQQEVSSKFDTISYAKGASVIKMIAHVMGLQQFQQGIQQYLQMNKLNNTTPEDLWRSLGNFTQNSNNSFENFVKSWILQPGYPVLNVRVNGTNVVITQERFLLSGQNNTKWHIPITYTTSRDNQKFTDTVTRVWLTPDVQEVVLVNVTVNSSDDWIILNNQQLGFYRVNYDETLWNRIHTLLTTKPDEIHVLNKAQIVDDLFNFAMANKTTISKVLNIISFLNESTDYYPWYSAFNGFMYSLEKINDQNLYKNYTDHIQKLMKKLYNSVSFSEEDVDNQIDNFKQSLAINWACHLNNIECVNNSKNMFAAYKLGSSVNKNLRMTVYCTGLRHSDNIQEDWQFLWDKFKSTLIGSEEEIILSSLGCTSNEAILKKYLSFAINETKIRRQDSKMVFSSVIGGHPNGFRVALQFLIENYQNVTDYYKDQNVVTSLFIMVVNRFTDQSHVEELRGFTQSGKLSNATADNLLAAARYNLLKTRTLESQLTQYFQEKSGSLATTIQNQRILLFIVAILWFYC